MKGIVSLSALMKSEYSKRDSPALGRFSRILADSFPNSHGYTCISFGRFRFSVVTTAYRIFRKGEVSIATDITNFDA